MIMLIIGIIIGFALAIIGQCSIEKEAVKNGFVKLDRKYYLITPFSTDD